MTHWGNFKENVPKVITIIAQTSINMAIREKKEKQRLFQTNHSTEF